MPKRESDPNRIAISLLICELETSDPKVHARCQRIREAIEIGDAETAAKEAFTLGVGHFARFIVRHGYCDAMRKDELRKLNQRRSAAARAEERKRAILDLYARIPDDVHRRGRMAVYRYIVGRLAGTRCECKVSVVRAALKGLPIASG